MEDQKNPEPEQNQKNEIAEEKLDNDSPNENKKEEDKKEDEKEDEKRQLLYYIISEVDL